MTLIVRVYTSWVVVRIWPARRLVAILELDGNGRGHPSSGPSAGEHFLPFLVRNVAQVRMAAAGVLRQERRVSSLGASRQGECHVLGSVHRDCRVATIPSRPAALGPRRPRAIPHQIGQEPRFRRANCLGTRIGYSVRIRRSDRDFRLGRGDLASQERDPGTKDFPRTKA